MEEKLARVRGYLREKGYTGAVLHGRTISIGLPAAETAA